MRTRWLAAALCLVPAAPASAATIVVSAEAHVDSITVMNMGADPILVDFLAQPASEVDHSVLGTAYTIPSIGILRWNVTAATAAAPLAFRVHALRCDGTTRCAGEATNILPGSGMRNVVIRASGEDLLKTVIDVTWGADSVESYSVTQNQLPAVPFSLVLTDGELARTITVSGTEVDPGDQSIVIGIPPLVSPQAGILDPYLQPPSVYPEVPTWGVDDTYGDPIT